MIDYILIALKLIVGISILNVWLVQPQKATRWRGKDAKNIFEEFKVYGLSKSFCYVIGFLKVSLALILLISIYFENLAIIGSAGLALLLLGSILMHLKVKDALFKSFPSFLFVIMNLVIVYYNF
jgi:hypothetical protein